MIEKVFEVNKVEKYVICDTEIQLWSDGPYHYEITTTVNQKMYPCTNQTNLDLWETFDITLKKYLEVTFEIPKPDYLVIVREYQKNGMIHWHCCLSGENPIPARARNSIIGGLNQNFGLSHFKQVADFPAFQKYLEKDLSTNYERYKKRHYDIYEFERLKSRYD